MTKAPEKAATSQRKRFIEAARTAGAVEDEANFEQQLKAVAGANSISGATDAKPKPSRKK